jgi:hypothetical protein
MSVVKVSTPSHVVYVGIQGPPGAQGEGGSGGGLESSAEIDISCAAGQPLYVKTTGHLGLAQADSLMTAQVVGLSKSNVIASTGATYILAGILELLDWTVVIGTQELAPGMNYFLSPDNPGMLMATPPDANAVGQFLVPVGKALSFSRFAIEVEPIIVL